MSLLNFLSSEVICRELTEHDCGKVSGILFGLIIAMMHFTASFSASFRVAYNPVQTVISIALACFAAVGIPSAPVSQAHSC